MHLGKMKMILRAIIFSLVTFCSSCKAGNSILDNYNASTKTKPVILELSRLLEANESSLAKNLISKDNISIDVVDDKGRTLLISAIVSENYTTAKMLLELGANPNFLPQGKYKSPMGWAAQYKHTKFLQLLLEFDGNPDLFNQGDRTSAYPILSAISAKRKNNLKTLIDVGADLNVVDPRGLTPLMYGAAASAWEMVYMLLDAGADPLIQNKWGENLFSYLSLPDLGTQGEALEWRKKVTRFLDERNIKN